MNNKSSLEAAAEAAAKVNAMLIAKGKLKPPPSSVVKGKGGNTKSAGDLYTAEVEINDAPLSARNLLTRGHTQDEINKYSGAAVSTRGRYMNFEERAKNTGERPLYLYVQASEQHAVDLAVQRIHEIIQQHMQQQQVRRNNKFHKFAPRGSVNGSQGPRPPPLMSIQTSMPSVEKIFVGLDHAPPAFDLRNRVVGSNGTNLHFIRSETGAMVTLRGKGSGFIEPTTGGESVEPMHLFVEHTKFEGLQSAKQLSQNLVETLQQEFAQWQQQQQQQQLNSLTLQSPVLHQNQLQQIGVGGIGQPGLVAVQQSLPQQEVMQPSGIPGIVTSVALPVVSSVPTILTTQVSQPVTQITAVQHQQQQHQHQQAIQQQHVLPPHLQASVIQQQQQQSLQIHQPVAPQHIQMTPGQPAFQFQTMVSHPGLQQISAQPIMSQAPSMMQQPMASQHTLQPAISLAQGVIPTSMVMTQPVVTSQPQQTQLQPMTSLSSSPHNQPPPMVSHSYQVPQVYSQAGPPTYTMPPVTSQVHQQQPAVSQMSNQQMNPQSQSFISIPQGAVPTSYPYQYTSTTAIQGVPPVSYPVYRQEQGQPPPQPQQLQQQQLQQQQLQQQQPVPLGKPRQKRRFTEDVEPTDGYQPGGPVITNVMGQPPPPPALSPNQQPPRQGTGVQELMLGNALAPPSLQQQQHQQNQQQPQQQDRDKQLMPPPPPPSSTGDKGRTGANELDVKRQKGALSSVAGYGSDDEDQGSEETAQHPGNQGFHPNISRQNTFPKTTFTHYSSKPQIYNNQQGMQNQAIPPSFQSGPPQPVQHNVYVQGQQPAPQLQPVQQNAYAPQTQQMPYTTTGYQYNTNVPFWMLQQ